MPVGVLKCLSLDEWIKIHISSLSSFFIYSSIHGHLGQFRILVIVSNAVANIKVYNLFKLVFLFTSENYPEMKLLDHMLVLFLVFCGAFKLFSIVAAPIDIYQG